MKQGSGWRWQKMENKLKTNTEVAHFLLDWYESAKLGVAMARLSGWTWGQATSPIHYKKLELWTGRWHLVASSTVHPAEFPLSKGIGPWLPSAPCMCSMYGDLCMHHLLGWLKCRGKKPLIKVYSNKRCAAKACTVTHINWVRLFHYFVGFI